jgi:hypothetical protein
MSGDPAAGTSGHTQVLATPQSHVDEPVRRPEQAEPIAAPGPDVSNGSGGSGDSGGGRTKPNWMLIAACVAVPVLLWFAYNARNRGNDHVVAEQTDAMAESTASPLTTEVAVPLDTLPSTVPAPVPDPAIAPTVDPQLIETCVEFTQFAAYIGDPEMMDLLTAAGFDIETLRTNCSAMPVAELERIAQRKADMDLFMSGGSTTTTVPAPDAITAAPTTALPTSDQPNPVTPTSVPPPPTPSPTLPPTFPPGTTD